MSITKVDRAIAKPNHCAVYPHLGQAHEKGYWDTGNEIPSLDPHVYVSVVAVEELARRQGWASPDEHRVAEGQRDAALGRVESLERELEEAHRTIQAIDYLGSRDFIARRKTGRPTKERQAA